MLHRLWDVSLLMSQFPPANAREETLRSACRERLRLGGEIPFWGEGCAALRGRAGAVRTRVLVWILHSQVHVHAATQPPAQASLRCVCVFQRVCERACVYLCAGGCMHALARACLLACVSAYGCLRECLLARACLRVCGFMRARSGLCMRLYLCAALVCARV